MSNNYKPQAVRDVNSVNLFMDGNLTKDVEIEITPNGRKVANVRIATNRTFRDENGKEQTFTKFANVKVWGAVAESLESNAKKGALVKFDVRVKPNAYFSEKKDRVVLEQTFTARRFKVIFKAKSQLN